MVNKLRYQEIIIDSADFRTGDRNKPTIQFDQDIDDSEYFQVQRVTIPTTYYVFDARRVSLALNGSPVASVTWPQGNYTVQEWIPLLLPLLLL